MLGQKKFGKLKFPTYCCTCAVRLDAWSENSSISSKALVSAGARLAAAVDFHAAPVAVPSAVVVHSAFGTATDVGPLALRVAVARASRTRPGARVEPVTVLDT